MKFIHGVVAAALLMLSLSTGCASQSNESLVFTLEQALATSPGGTDFTRVIQGDWSRVCIFRPQTPYERVDSVIGARPPGVAGAGSRTPEDSTLIAFVRGSAVESNVLYPVSKGDFGTRGPEQWYCLPRERAVFELRQPIDGSIPWIGPADNR